MKKLVVALALLFTVGAKPAPSPDPAYNIEVSVTPVVESSIQLLPHQWRDGFKCSATVMEMTSGKALRVETVVQPGKRGVEERTANDLKVLFRADIAANREAAETEVVLRRGDTVLLRQRSVTRFVAAPQFSPR